MAENNQNRSRAGLASARSPSLHTVHLSEIAPPPVRSVSHAMIPTDSVYPCETPDLGCSDSATQPQSTRGNPPSPSPTTGQPDSSPSRIKSCTKSQCDSLSHKRATGSKTAAAPPTAAATNPEAKKPPPGGDWLRQAAKEAPTDDRGGAEVRMGRRPIRWMDVSRNPRAGTGNRDGGPLLSIAAKPTQACACMHPSDLCLEHPSQDEYDGMVPSS